MDKTTKPFREHLIERLKTPEDAGGYLAASLQDNADCPEATGLVIQDIIAAFKLPLEVTSRASVAAPPPDTIDPIGDFIEAVWRLTNDRDGWSRITLRGLAETFARQLCAPSPVAATVDAETPPDRRIVYSKDVMDTLSATFDSLQGQKLPVSEVGFAIYRNLAAVPEFAAATSSLSSEAIREAAEEIGASDDTTK